MDIPKDKRFIDIGGKQFGRLKVVSYAGKSRWLCLCSCGTEKTIGSGAIRSGSTRSCGCLQIEETISRSTVHGSAGRKGKSPEYWSWSAMNARCRNKKSKSYKNYGGRGITVCERWAGSFQNFVDDMGKKPSESHTLDRIDNSRGYEPGNCRWGTRIEQGNNRRNNRVEEVDGKSRTIADWSRVSGIPAKRIRTRLRRGWCPRKAIFTPLRRQQ